MRYRRVSWWNRLKVKQTTQRRYEATGTAISSAQLSWLAAICLSAQEEESPRAATAAAAVFVSAPESSTWAEGHVTSSNEQAENMLQSDYPKIVFLVCVCWCLCLSQNGLRQRQTCCCSIHLILKWKRERERERGWLRGQQEWTKVWQWRLRACSLHWRMADSGTL